jgi:hypothetical protein
MEPGTKHGTREIGNGRNEIGSLSKLNTFINITDEAISLS